MNPPANTVAGWVVKPIEIDDVPIVTATLWSDRYDDFALRRVAEELESKLQAVENTGRTRIGGGRPRQIRIEFDPQLLAGRRVSRPLKNLWDGLSSPSDRLESRSHNGKSAFLNGLLGLHNWPPPFAG